MPFIAEGVIPATLVAFHQDYEIDVEASRKHLRDVAAVDGSTLSRLMVTHRRCMPSPKRTTTPFG